MLDRGPGHGQALRSLNKLPKPRPQHGHQANHNDQTGGNARQKNNRALPEIDRL